MLEKRLRRSQDSLGHEPDHGTLNDKRAPVPASRFRTKFVEPMKESAIQEPSRRHDGNKAMDRGEEHILVMLRALKWSQKHIYGGAFKAGQHDMHMDSIFSRMKALLKKKKAGQKLSEKKGVDYNCFRNAVARLTELESGQPLATVLSNMKNQEHKQIMHEFLVHENIQVPVLESK